MREEIASIENMIQEQAKQYDQKIVKLRNEIDYHSFTKLINKKANEEQVRNDFNNHEFKINTLDRNLIRMATDFEVFQVLYPLFNFKNIESFK